MGIKVLILSQRRIADLVAYCLAYELEDTLAGLTGAERIDVTDRPGLELSRKAYKLARMASGSPKLARKWAPAPRARVVLERDYDLFFPIFNSIYEIHALNMIPNWRERSRKACCFVTEAWTDKLPGYLIELLSELDHIYLGSRNAVQEVARLTGRPCSYLPLAADVLRFAPPSPDAPRPIAVCNIGRRSQVTHQALLAESEKQQFLYYYDTVAASGADLKHRTFRVDNASEHRRMLASLLKNSRFFFANRSYVNIPELTAGHEELSARFYEGAASGAVMIGEAPRTEEFRTQFDWPDAVIHVPFDSPDIGQILAELNGQPDRISKVRVASVREAARRHDWLYRIRSVFDTLGLPETEEMGVRGKRLDAIATQTSTVKSWAH